MKIGTVETAQTADSFKLKVSPRDSHGLGVIISFDRSEAKTLLKQIEFWLNGNGNSISVKVPIMQ
ncbi:MAG: hypothetical protein ACREBS_05000 [Nitrososphaerales archaeon]